MDTLSPSCPGGVVRTILKNTCFVATTIQFTQQQQRRVDRWVWKDGVYGISICQSCGASDSVPIGSTAKIASQTPHPHKDAVCIRSINNTAIMSRFWAAGGSSSSDDDSERDSDSDSSGSGSENDDNLGGGGGGGLGQTGQQEANRWLAMSDDSSDEDSVRVVLSGKERFQESVTTSISALRKAMKSRDYYEIQVQFDILSKALIKNKQYLVNGVPRPLVRILVDLEDFAAERLLDKAQFQTLSARQGRALNRMKLTFKKHNRAYQTVMAAYRANPVVSDAEDDNDDDDAAGHDKKHGADSSDSDSSSSSSSSSSSDSDSDKKDSDDEDDDDDSVRVPYCARL
jgi:Eukaryotic translation initiation factor 3 subunit 8 N-terminus